MLRFLLVIMNNISSIDYCCFFGIFLHIDLSNMWPVRALADPELLFRTTAAAVLADMMPRFRGLGDEGHGVWGLGV